MADIDAQINRVIAMVRARVEHPFRVLKRQFGYMKTRYRGLAKNTAIAHAVCTVQPVDGAAHAAAGDAGMSVSECGRSAAKQTLPCARPVMYALPAASTAMSFAMSSQTSPRYVE